MAAEHRDENDYRRHYRSCTPFANLMILLVSASQGRGGESQRVLKWFHRLQEDFQRLRLRGLHQDLCRCLVLERYHIELGRPPTSTNSVRDSANHTYIHIINNLCAFLTGQFLTTKYRFCVLANNSLCTERTWPRHSHTCHWKVVNSESCGSVKKW